MLIVDKSTSVKYYIPHDGVFAIKIIFWKNVEELKHTQYIMSTRSKSTKYTYLSGYACENILPQDKYGGK